MKLFVSRQIYWGVEESDSHTVEIASGGRDYSNPDMLVAKYPGEGEEYTNPIEAVKAAIAIATAWKKDCPKLKINIAHGNTGGCTMPFEGSTRKELRAWAEKLYESLPKCDGCGGLIGGDPVIISDEPDFKFCGEYCAEKFIEINSEIKEEVA